MIDMLTVPPREFGRIATQALEIAQAQNSNSTTNTYRMLADAAEELRSTMRMVKLRLREIQDIWIADQLSAELEAGTFNFTYMTKEQVVELMAGQQALIAFFATPITVATDITVTPDIMVSRTKPPLANWGAPTAPSVTPPVEPPGA